MAVNTFGRRSMVRVSNRGYARPGQIGLRVARMAYKGYQAYKKQRTEPRGNQYGRGENKLEGGVTTQNDSRTLYVKRKANKSLIRKKRKLRKLNKSLDRVDQPNNTILFNSQFLSIIKSSTEKQKWYPFLMMDTTDVDKFRNFASAIMQGGQVADTDMIDSDKSDNYRHNVKPYVKHISWELTGQMHVDSTHTSIVDVYYMRCKRDMYSSEFATVPIMLDNDFKGQSSFVEGDGDGNQTIGIDPTSTYATNTAVSPYEHRLLGRYFSCYKKKQFIMTAGQAFTLNGIYKVNKQLPKRPLQVQTCKSGLTELILVCIRTTTYDVGPETGNSDTLSTVFTKVGRFFQTEQKTPTMSIPI